MPKKAATQAMTEKELESIATRFRAIGEVSRLKLVFAAGQGEKNVTELIAATGLSQANVSKHLRILTEAGLLVRRKKGIFVLYSTPNAAVFKLIAMVTLRK